VSKKVALEKMEKLYRDAELLSDIRLCNIHSYTKWKRIVRVTIDDILPVNHEYRQALEKALQTESVSVFPESTSVRRALPILQSIKNDIIYWPEDETVCAPTAVSVIKSPESKVLIVNGNSEEMALAVTGFIKDYDVTPFLLHEGQNGANIFMEHGFYSGVDCAVVVLSRDDFKFRPRSQSNVVLEIGYLMGKLGKEKVIVLYREFASFKIPLEYSGATHIEYDDDGSWQDELAGALRNRGIRLSSEELVNSR
jgi:predicted nucleotide-binding protein